jgi:hypothetical protein
MRRRVTLALSVFVGAIWITAVMGAVPSVFDLHSVMHGIIVAMATLTVLALWTVFWIIPEPLLCTLVPDPDPLGLFTFIFPDPPNPWVTPEQISFHRVIVGALFVLLIVLPLSAIWLGLSPSVH